MYIKTLRTHPHGGNYRKVGEVYDCPDKKAKLLIFIGKAEEYYEYETPPATYNTTQLDVERTTALTASTDKVEATAAALRLAQENSVDLSQVHGSGIDGKITKTDVENLIE